MKPRVHSIPTLIMAALSAGCQSTPGGTPEAGGGRVLPIAPGAYVKQDEGCGDPVALFRYDGRRIGWTGGGGSGAAMYPIRRLREEQGRWVATIVAPGPGAGGGSAPRELDVVIVKRGAGRITVTAMERLDMKLCAPDELPRWAHQ
jgi:hypothetical protein